MVLVTERLVPVKFVFLMCNVFLFIVCAYHRDANISRGLEDDASQQDWDEAKRSVQTCAALGVVLLVLELALLVAGLTLFFNQTSVVRKNYPEILLHCFGVVFLSWYLLEEWTYSLLWAIWVFIALTPFLLDVLAIVNHRFLLKPRKNW